MADKKHEGIDAEVIDEMHRERIDLSSKSDEEVARCEINFLAELLSMMGKVNKSLDTVQNTLSIVGAERLAAYFKQLDDNLGVAKRQDAISEKAAQDHKPKKKKVKKDEPAGD